MCRKRAYVSWKYNRVCLNPLRLLTYLLATCSKEFIHIAFPSLIIWYEYVTFNSSYAWTNAILFLATHFAWIASTAESSKWRYLPLGWLMVSLVPLSIPVLLVYWAYYRCRRIEVDVLFPIGISIAVCALTLAVFLAASPNTTVWGVLWSFIIIGSAWSKSVEWIAVRTDLFINRHITPIRSRLEVARQMSRLGDVSNLPDAVFELIGEYSSYRGTSETFDSSVAAGPSVSESAPLLEREPSLPV